jgi:hypothetical protein
VLQHERGKHHVIGRWRETGRAQVANDGLVEISGFLKPHAHGFGAQVIPVT